MRKRAKNKVVELVKELEASGSSRERIEVIKQCSEPILISSIAYNMVPKDELEYDSEEKNIYSALKQFSSDIKSDLRLLGNFDEVKALFDEVVVEKEHILEQKAKSFIPNAKEELKGLLLSYKERSENLILVLEENDREQLLEQKKFIESQINEIKSDIASVFGELAAKLEIGRAHV